MVNGKRQVSQRGGLWQSSDVNLQCVEFVVCAPPHHLRDVLTQQKLASQGANPEGAANKVHKKQKFGQIRVMNCKACTELLF